MMAGRILELVVLTLFLATASAGEEQLTSTVKLEYRKPYGSLYQEIIIFDAEDVIRVLTGDAASGGLFERERMPRFSPDGTFVYIGQVEWAEVEMPNGQLKRHEVAYCNLVELHSGCIAARETGEFCGGEFTLNGKWDNSLYPDFDLLNSSPKAIDFVEARRAPSHSPETSFDNILACDPPNARNIDVYRKLLQRNIFDVSAEHKLIIEKPANHSRSTQN